MILITYPQTILPANTCSMLLLVWAAMRLERANLSFTQLGNSFDNDRFRGRLKTQSLLMKLEGVSLGAL